MNLEAKSNLLFLKACIYFPAQKQRSNTSELTNCLVSLEVTFEANWMFYGFNELIQLNKESSFDPFHRDHETGKEYNQSILLGPIVDIICIHTA